MENDTHFMRRALELARRGEGFVEPNPMVGCVLVREGQIVGEGFHRRFGGPHAEVEALRAAGERAHGATAYVTLEPCSHHGKTPPCTDALLAAGVRRVVVALRDPNPAVHGQGLQILRNAGVEIVENVLTEEVRDLLAPYTTLLEKRRPWIIAKWAMTLDGRSASRSGSSQWISGEPSRLVVHRLRARMDGILVGAGTVRCDNPRLTVRLLDREERARTPLRIVLDSRAEIPLTSRLIQTARETPLLVVVGDDASPAKMTALRQTGCEVLPIPAVAKGELLENRYARQIETLLTTLAERNLTNLLVEGGSRVFGLLFDWGLIDEVHAFIAPKLIGGKDAVPAIAGRGLADMEFPYRLKSPQISILDDDVYVCGRMVCSHGVQQRTK